MFDGSFRSSSTHGSQSSSCRERLRPVELDPSLASVFKGGVIYGLHFIQKVNTRQKTDRRILLITPVGIMQVTQSGKAKRALTWEQIKRVGTDEFDGKVLVESGDPSQRDMVFYWKEDPRNTASPPELKQLIEICAKPHKRGEFVVWGDARRTDGDEPRIGKGARKQPAALKNLDLVSSVMSSPRISPSNSPSCSPRASPRSFSGSVAGPNSPRRKVSVQLPNAELFSLGPSVPKDEADAARDTEPSAQAPLKTTFTFPPDSASAKSPVLQDQQVQTAAPLDDYTASSTPVADTGLGEGLRALCDGSLVEGYTPNPASPSLAHFFVPSASYNGWDLGSQWGSDGEAVQEPDVITVAHLPSTSRCLEQAELRALSEVRSGKSGGSRGGGTHAAARPVPEAVSVRCMAVRPMSTGYAAAPPAHDKLSLDDILELARLGYDVRELLM
ncbi:hypothetical protein DIPPA_00300 [Diplonema papillatum]|nr:hypothetical protein DIPPA_00300 [Diplonema papillatum]